MESRDATRTSLNRCSLNFVASLEQAYSDLQSVQDILKRQDSDIFELVHRIHGMESRVSALVASLNGTVEDLRQVRKNKMVLLSSILRENTRVAERIDRNRNSLCGDKRRLSLAKTTRSH